MSIMWGIIWAILILLVMTVTIKYYLPKLVLRVQQSHSEEPSPVQEKQMPKAGFVTGLIICALFSGVCGYVAYEQSASLLGMLKMTIAFGVLSCAFVTDLKLMLIPNLCSILMLAGRLITILAEFIWMREEAVAWLENSLIAMIASFLLLFLLSRVTHGGIGLGDVKLFSSLGFLCGIRAVCYTLVLAFLVCTIVSTFFLLTKKKNLKDALPLGPFIWIGYGISILLSII